MNIQLALDRMTVAEAIQMASIVKEQIDWIEVGTSLIKEFGVDSVQQIKAAFPNKVVVADIKTIDNAAYELDLCFQAGADVATVMGVAPFVTIEKSLEVASKWKKEIMIDLLNTSKGTQTQLFNYEAIFCSHVSKDEQEHSGQQNKASQSYPDFYQAGRKVAIAGGITLESLKEMHDVNPYVVIVGSAITKANDPVAVAHAFHTLASGRKSNDKN
jgi:3-hexulose-6-phosphate synthase